MAFVELTRILPNNEKVKWSINTNNVIYFEEPVDNSQQAGCMLFPGAGVEVYVAESYQDVKAKLAIS